MTSLATNAIAAAMVMTALGVYASRLDTPASVPRWHEVPLRHPGATSTSERSNATEPLPPGVYTVAPTQTDTERRNRATDIRRQEVPRDTDGTATNGANKGSKRFVCRAREDAAFCNEARDMRNGDRARLTTIDPQLRLYLNAEDLKQYEIMTGAERRPQNRCGLRHANGRYCGASRASRTIRSPTTTRSPLRGLKAAPRKWRVVCVGSACHVFPASTERSTMPRQPRRRGCGCSLSERLIAID
jgi:hypothetical protein